MLASEYSFLIPEVFAAELSAAGVPFDALTINFLGAFKKAFRPEIESVQISDEAIPAFSLSLNRDGLYDRLPEGLFHQPKGNSKITNVQDMVGEFRRGRNEERLARNFFQPFEQEFFRYGTMVAREEQELSFSMLHGSLKNELGKFWNIPEGFPVSASNSLMRFMPWLPQIKGDKVLTAKSLAVLLDKKVSVTELVVDEHSTESCSWALGEGELGHSAVVGGFFPEPCLSWVFTIHDVPRTEIQLFRSQEVYGKLLTYFVQLFTPVTVDVTFEYTIEEKEEEPLLENFLGYSLVL